MVQRSAVADLKSSLPGRPRGRRGAGVAGPGVGHGLLAEVRRGYAPGVEDFIRIGLYLSAGLVGPWLLFRFLRDKSPRSRLLWVVVLIMVGLALFFVGGVLYLIAGIALVTPLQLLNRNKSPGSSMSKRLRALFFWGVGLAVVAAVGWVLVYIAVLIVVGEGVRL